MEHEQPLPDIMIYGPSGYGKTSIAHYVADRMGVVGNKKSPKFIRHNGSDLTNKASMEDFAFSIGRLDVVLIDELHDLATKKGMREMLFEIMDYRTLYGTPIHPFSLISATTEFGDIPTELSNRFMLKYQLNHYTEDHIKQILMGSLCPEDVADLIAKRGRCNPRESKLLLKRAKIEASASGSQLTVELVETMLKRIGIDSLGLSGTDRRILGEFYKKQSWLRRNAMGVQAIVELLGMKEPEYRLVHEPYLIKIGMLDKTPRGRILTIPGKEYVESLNEQ
jgi:Holliday junction DNA helicase RuvB